MKLSVVIVNYNVSHFLKQCLQSVQHAIANIEAEIWVVDNNSSDDSCAMVRCDFPDVKLIENKENVGFSRANNQAIEQSKGEFVLILNPDTLVEKDTFVTCIQFLEDTPKAGSVGVRMINGEGHFLPESKRALPVPSVAFYKVFGLSKLFPKSKRFSSYHLTNVNENETHAVEVLSGAYMMMRKEVIDKIGGLDGTFFMYGEDIDLSYRIILAGYENYYLPQARIIHYKGESTKKKSLNYVFVFYQAMQIFAKKHFTKNKHFLIGWVINFAIWMRASMAVFVRLFRASVLPIVDVLLLYGGMFCIARYWEMNVLALRNSAFPDLYYYAVIPIYIGLWIVAIALFKGYKKGYSPFNINRGVLVGTVAILLIYSLLPETSRFSRAVTIFSAGWAVFAMNMSHYFKNKIANSRLKIKSSIHRVILIIGDIEEQRRVAILSQVGEKKANEIYYISPAETLENIEKMVNQHHVNEMIFCMKNVEVKSMITMMERLKNDAIVYKTAPENSDVLIAPQNIQSPIF